MKVVFAWFVLPRRKKAEQGTQDRNLAISTEEKDAVAYNVYSKQKDAKLADRNPWKTATMIDLLPNIDEHLFPSFPIPII